MSAKTLKGFAISPIALAISFLQIAVYHGGIYAAVQSNYKVFKDVSINQMKAENDCKDNGGHLCSFTNAQEFMEIIKILDVSHRYWTGLTYSENGDPQFSDGANTQFANTKIESGSNVRNCVLVKRETNTVGRLIRVRCAERRHYICKITPTTQASLHNNITGNMSIDNKGKIYADGKFVLEINSWKVSSSFDLLESTKCIVIKACTTGASNDVGAILASFSNGILTDQSWQCISSDLKSLVVWPKAKSYAPNKKAAGNTWIVHHKNKTDAHINESAQWIWTTNMYEKYVTCRKSFVSDIPEIDCDPQVGPIDYTYMKEYVEKLKMIINPACDSTNCKGCFRIINFLTKKFNDDFTSNSYPTRAEINQMIASFEKIMVEFVKSKCVADRKGESFDIIKTSVELHIYFVNDSQNATSFLEKKTNGSVTMHLNFTEGAKVHVLHIKFKNISKLQIMAELGRAGHVLNFTGNLDSDIHAIKLFYDNVNIANFSRSDAVIFRFKNKGARGSKECLYLDPNKLEWFGDDFVLKGDSGSLTECHSNHLTNFAVFVSDEIPKTHEKALEVITYVGCALSLFGVLIMLILYCAFRKDLQIFSNDRYLVNLNLLLALGMTQILFLIGIAAFDNKTSCKAVAMLLHYSTLASLAWMLVEGIVLYIKVIKVYGGEAVRIRYFFIAAWGLPAIIVTVAASVNTDGYSSQHWCWLSFKDDYIWLLFGPVTAMLLTNFIILALVVRTVFKTQPEQNSANKSYTSIRAVVILCPILGLSWIFSIFALNFDSVAWQYLFAIFNGTQGFLIFIIYGIGKREIRSVLKGIFCRMSFSSISKLSGGDITPSGR